LLIQLIVDGIPLFFYFLFKLISINLTVISNLYSSSSASLSIDPSLSKRRSKLSKCSLNSSASVADSKLPFNACSNSSKSNFKELSQEFALL